MPKKIEKSDEEWREQLTPERYEVARRKGTEPPFDNEYWDEKRQGAYSCACCGQRLFKSDTKYDSGTGWPSFYAPVDPDAIETEPDLSGGRVRTEAICCGCGAHLGHVFDDGPAPTGLRYCMNSLSLSFTQQKPD